MPGAPSQPDGDALPFQTIAPGPLLCWGLSLGNNTKGAPRFAQPLSAMGTDQRSAGAVLCELAALLARVLWVCVLWACVLGAAVQRGAQASMPTAIAKLTRRLTIGTMDHGCTCAC